MERRLFFGLTAALLAAALVPIMPGPAFAALGLDIGSHVVRGDLHVWHSQNGWVKSSEVDAYAHAIDKVVASRHAPGFVYTISLSGKPPVGIPSEILAAMQPDNGAGSISGDRAQSVGKAGDLKAKRPDGVQSGSPGSRTVDARKTSWLTRRFLPVPS